LLVECLYASKDYQEAFNLLTSLEIEDMNSSMQNDTEIEQPLSGISSEPCKNDNAEAPKADSDAMIKIFLRPYVSLRKPHKCDVKMMPAITRK
jgi:hypothetical protein